jgi:hypothetical protein
VHDLDIEADITATRRIGKEGEAKGICAALRDSSGKRCFLVPQSLGHLVIFEVTSVELRMECLQFDAVDDIQRINDIAERLAHLAAF